MAIYQFECLETGQEVVVELPMSGKVPSIGSTITRGGRKLRRLPSDASIPCVKVEGYFKDYGINRNSKLARTADAYDAKGVPMFKGRRKADDFARRAKDSGVDMVFDG